MQVQAWRMAKGLSGAGPKRKGTVRDFLGTFAPHVVNSLPGGGDR